MTNKSYVLILTEFVSIIHRGGKRLNKTSQLVSLQHRGIKTVIVLKLNTKKQKKNAGANFFDS